MKFGDFIKNGAVKRGSADFQLAKSLAITANQDLIFLKTLEVTDNSARKVSSNYYDVLRSVLEALAALDGFKVYSHEAFTYYLRENGLENESAKFDCFRKIRNSINYYGKSISVEEAVEFVEDISGLIAALKEKLLKKLEKK